MDQLRQSELRAILDFIGDCYKIRSFEEFAQHIVNALPRLVSAEHVTYNEMNTQEETSHNCVNTPELATPTASRLWEEHMHEHPVLEYIVRTGDCRPVRISDFLSQSQLRDLGLYSDFYRDLSIEDALCFNLFYEPPKVVGIGLHRTRPFSDRERLVADIVRPHIVQAWQNAKVVSRTQCELQLANQGIESVGASVIVCTAELRVQFMTTAARCKVAEYFGVSQGLDSLPDSLLRWLAHQNAQLSTGNVPALRSPLFIDKGSKRLIIRLVSNVGGSLLLLEEEVTRRDASALGRLGLTRRETEVLSWVAQGKTNSDIASILSIDRKTVKKHLEHIFQKLGVETRTAAAALVFEQCTESAPKTFQEPS